MRDIYGVTRVLLVPSRVPETFGRVVVEAQSSGIPVLATSCGALPWVVGGGGKLLPLEDDSNDWASSLREIVAHPKLEAELSERALRNVERAEFQPRLLLDSYERLLLAAVGEKVSAPAGP
jgi:glycosyltransferase involved in cell wall biosynthesis